MNTFDSSFVKTNNGIDPPFGKAFLLITKTVHFLRNGVHSLIRQQDYFTIELLAGLCCVPRHW